MVIKKDIVISAHQPEYLPYLGFIHKAMRCDKFILVDHVQFKKDNFQNRNRIMTSNGPMWLTVPLKNYSLDTPIKDIKIDNGQPWAKRHLKGIQFNYSGTKYYDKYITFFEDTFNKKWDKLIDLNVHIIKFLFEQFGAKPKILLSSNMDIKGQKTEMIISLCKAYKSDIFIAGSGGKEYIDLDLTKRNGINIIFSDFEHPLYSQKFKPFSKNMSGIDLLFNYGPKAKEMIK